MSVFSFFSKKKSAAVSSVPPEIMRAVSIMGRPSPQEAGEDPSSLQQKAASSVGKSPFLGGGAFSENSKIEEPQTPTSLAPVWNPETSPELKPLFDDRKKLHVSPKKWVIFGGILLTLLFLFLAGGTYWYVSKEDGAPEMVPEDEASAVPVIQVAVAPLPPFSLDTANYLQIDTETMTPESYRLLLLEPSRRITEAGITAPVEFLLTDKNNNPIAFSRFAYLMNLDLQPEFLSGIAEGFSLFLYNENGKVVPGLRLSLTDTSIFERQKESTLPFSFRSLLYSGAAVPKEVAFRSGVYNGQSVRFVNIDSVENTSFDYALRNNEWVIGTSKGTLRAILDK